MDKGQKSNDIDAHSYKPNCQKLCCDFARKVSQIRIKCDSFMHGVNGISQKWNCRAKKKAYTWSSLGWHSWFLLNEIIIRGSITRENGGIDTNSQMLFVLSKNVDNSKVADGEKDGKIKKIIRVLWFRWWKTRENRERLFFCTLILFLQDK